MGAAPSLPLWSQHLLDLAKARGLPVEVRRGRNGSRRWRLGGTRWLDTATAHRRLEVALYGRENP